jgi:hypothetical protein
MHHVPVVRRQHVLDELLERRQIPDVKQVTGEVRHLDAWRIAVLVRALRTVRRREDGNAMACTCRGGRETPAIAPYPARVRREFMREHQDPLAHRHSPNSFSCGV